MSLNPFKASGYQNECKVQAAWLNAFWAVGLHEIGKLTSSITGPSPAPGGAAATVRSALADDQQRKGEKCSDSKVHREAAR